MNASTNSTASPRQSGLLDMLAWAMADNSHPRAWWADRLGMDEEELEELLLPENDRLVRARMLKALGETTGSREVARAVRGRVIEILAGMPKASVLAQIALSIKRLPMWIAAEWISRTKLVKGELHPVTGQVIGGDEEDRDGWAEMPDVEGLNSAIAEAKALLKKMDES